MQTLAELLADEGIRLRSYQSGGYKLTCARCSHQRRNKTDPCLSVTIAGDGGAVWHCHNCQWAGSVREQRERARYEPNPRQAPKQPPEVSGDLPQETLEWFKRRGISEAVVQRNGIFRAETWMPGCERGQKVPALVFPYRRGGDVVNHKYRTLDKRFRQDKAAEKIWYGLDDIAGNDTAIVVEGELDKLALEEAGYLNVLSVPDGAPKTVKDGTIDPEDDAKFSFIWCCRDELAHVERFILACDADDPGKALTEELARRLGREKCWTVQWPAIDGAAIKDANQVLIEEGPEVVHECIEAAKPLPIRGLHDADDYRAQVFDLYEHGHEKVFSTGWSSLDQLFKIRPGDLTVVTGVPNSGKSEFIDALTVNLAEQLGWRFALCSFENAPNIHLSKLAEKRLKQPFWDGPTPRMVGADLDRALDWIDGHFSFIRPGDDDSPTIDWILEQARAAVMRYGIRGLVIDPYNEIEHSRPDRMSETEYVSQCLSKVKRFAQNFSVHVFFVAHPAKMRPENGKIPVPSLYDISGSAHWVNKADCGIVVHRDAQKTPPETDIHIRKIRHKFVGRLGKATLRYDRATGRYSDPPQQQFAWQEREAG